MFRPYISTLFSVSLSPSQTAQRCGVRAALSDSDASQHSQLPVSILVREAVDTVTISTFSGHSRTLNLNLAELRRGSGFGGKWSRLHVAPTPSSPPTALYYHQPPSSLDFLGTQKIHFGSRRHFAHDQYNVRSEDPANSLHKDTRTSTT